MSRQRNSRAAGTAVGPRLARTLSNIAGFQLGWLACVLGGNLIGAAVVTLVLAAHLRWIARPGEWRWLSGFALLGLAIDGGLGLAGGFTFPADQSLYRTLIAPPYINIPVWLWLLWPLFATLLHHSLSWLWRWPWLAVAGGAVSAPLSYLAGARLASIGLAPWLIAVEALIWAGLCLWLSLTLGKRPTAGHHSGC